MTKKTKTKTIDQKATSWNNRVMVGAFISVVVGTNAFNSYVQDIYYNKERIEYNEGASKRRLNNAVKEINYQTEIKDLQQDLKRCNDGGL